MVARVRLTIFGRGHACHMGHKVAACKQTSALAEGLRNTLPYLSIVGLELGLERHEL
jgi:hypothetical protein